MLKYKTLPLLPSEIPSTVVAFFQLHTILHFWRLMKNPTFASFQFHKTHLSLSHCSPLLSWWVIEVSKHPALRPQPPVPLPQRQSRHTTQCRQIFKGLEYEYKHNHIYSINSHMKDNHIQI